MNRWGRTELIYGTAGVDRLKNSRIAIFGLGGVGSYAAEAVLRSGVGHIDVFDYDIYEYSNFNRQLYADEVSRGKLKVSAFSEHAAAVNPDAVISCFSEKLTESNICKLRVSEYDFVMDAIDDRAAKIALIAHVLRENVKLISAMGAGNKVRPECLMLSSIYKTKYCPLAKIMRAEAKRRGLPDFPVVYSEEIPRASQSEKMSSPIGSTSFVPSTMGLIMAGYVINHLADPNYDMV